MKEAVEVEPLTRVVGDGVLKRRPEVEAQVAEMLRTDPNDMLSRVAVADFQDPAFVKHETVAFLIRYHRRTANDDRVNKLVTLFITRLTRAIEKRIRFIAENLMAGRRSVGLSLWHPQAEQDWTITRETGPEVTFLPSRLWLIGLGHLGQKKDFRISSKAPFY